MAVGKTNFSKVQFGREVTPGTAVAATVLWRGPMSALEDTTSWERQDESIGLLGGSDRRALVATGGTMTLEETTASYEQAGLPLVMLLGFPYTGVADGAGNGYVYTHNIPTTTAPTVTSFTTQAGEGAVEVERAPYTLATSVTFSGAGRETLKISADLVSRTVERFVSGFTAIAVPAVEDIVFTQGRFYMDPATGAYGATQMTGTVKGLELELNAEWTLNYTMDGRLDFSSAELTGYSITGEITFKSNDQTTGASGKLKDDFRVGTSRLIRLEWKGSALTGGTETNKRLTIDLPIQWDGVSALEDDDGELTLTAQFTSRYNSTKGDAGKIVIVNKLATLL